MKNTHHWHNDIKLAISKYKTDFNKCKFTANDIINYIISEKQINEDNYPSITSIINNDQVTIIGNKQGGSLEPEERDIKWNTFITTIHKIKYKSNKG
jgi:hypothetical protein